MVCHQTDQFNISPVELHSQLLPLFFTIAYVNPQISAGPTQEKNYIFGFSLINIFIALLFNKYVKLSKKKLIKLHSFATGLI
jgi:hypothetical protein